MTTRDHFRGGRSRRLAPVQLTAIALLVGFLIALVLPPALAAAQPGHEGHNHAQPTAGQPANEAARAEQPAVAGKGFTNLEGESTTKAAALVFWLLAALVLGGSLFVITRRNMVTAVMGMVGTFIALAGLYAMLYAHFLAAIQVVVYAGAIMVLFVFVIMILNRAEEEPWALQGLFGKALAGLSLAYLFYRLADVLWSVKDATHASEAAVIPGGFEFGSTKAVGKILFTDYLFPFEAVSIVLLVSVVGAIAIARPKRPDEDERPESPAIDADGEGAEA